MKTDSELKNRSPIDPLKAFSLDGEVALITGGGTGLGLAMAQCLGACGARVVLVGRCEETLSRSCKTIGPLADYRVQDITDFDRSESLPESVFKSHGSLDILINNAGVHLKKTAEETSIQEFREIIDTHIFGAHALVRSAIPLMTKRGHGNILFTASMTTFLGIPRVFAYSTAKTAYAGMVRALSSEVADKGIRVNAIAPGWIDTPMLRKALNNDEPRRQKILNRTPMQTLGEPIDIGWTAAFLCSPAAKFITGAIIPVDGGASIGF